MRNRSLAKRYASALMELAVEKKMVDRVEKDLSLFSQALTTNNQLAEVIFGQFATEVKQRVVREVFSGRVDSLTLKFIQFVFAKHREDELLTIIDVFHEKVRAWKGMIDVEVLSAVKLADSDLSSLRRRLESMTGKKVVIDARVAPELIGGLRVKIGDLVIDGSLSTRLRLAAEQLSNTSV